MLLLCEVDLGRSSVRSLTDESPVECPRGFDSLTRCDYAYDPGQFETVRDEHGAIFYTGKTDPRYGGPRLVADEQDTLLYGPKGFSEFIVYDASRIKIRRLVRVQLAHERRVDVVDTLRR